jgi:hypothetical protein
MVREMGKGTTMDERTFLCCFVLNPFSILSHPRPRILGSSVAMVIMAVRQVPKILLNIGKTFIVSYSVSL